MESLGRVLLQFYRAVNLLYRKSAEGKQPEWVAHWLDQGKPADLIALQRSPALKNEVPRVIRPDLLLTEHGLSVTELDSVPGGIGLTGWLNQTYSALGAEVLGGADGMLRGFASIFGDAPTVHIVVSEEAATYRPEMFWLASQLGNARFKVQDSRFEAFADGDAAYRFFELFDLANVPNAKKAFELASARRIRLTPPPKPVFEEKMLFALLWNRNLHELLAAGTGRRFLPPVAGPGSLHLAGRSRSPAPARRHSRTEPDRLAPTQGALPKGARADPESLRILSPRLGRARRLSRQRPFPCRLGGGGG